MSGEKYKIPKEDFLDPMKSVEALDIHEVTPGVPSSENDEIYLDGLVRE
jgi:hypothetical protein